MFSDAASGYIGNVVVAWLGTSRASIDVMSRRCKIVAHAGSKDAEGGAG